MQIQSETSEKNYYYKIMITKVILFSTTRKLEGEEEIVDYALDNLILDPHDGDPFFAMDYADEITEEQYFAEKAEESK